MPDEAEAVLVVKEPGRTKADRKINSSVDKETQRNRRGDIGVPFDEQKCNS